LYGYVGDVNWWIDPWGLNLCTIPSGNELRITPGKNFRRHFLNHKKLVEQVTGNRYSRLIDHAQQFLDDMTGLINGGRVTFVGSGTLKNGQPPVNVFRGEGITIVLKPNNEWVTTLQTGSGLDTAIRFVNSAGG
jgi:hypothetical protein